MRVVQTLVLLFLATAAARADDLADFAAAIGAAGAQNRAAIGALQNGNIELAELELERLRAAWREVSERKRPGVFKDDTFYVTAITDIATRLVSADMMLKSGRPEIARAALAGIRDDVYSLRQSAGIVALEDCVRDANAAMDALAAYGDGAVDLAGAETAADLAAKARRYGETLARCDGLAGPVKSDPEFRRLVDGVGANVTLVATAIAARDAGLLRHTINELRTLDTLLALRFG